MDNAGLKRLVGRALTAHGFQRKGGAWYLRRDDAVAVINLQKDDFSDAWFVNLGVWINALGENEWPKAHTCHVQARVPRLWPGRKNEIERLFDLGDPSIPDAARATAVSTFLVGDLVPLCESLAKKESLAAIVNSVRGASLRVMLSARTWLGMAPLE